MGNGHDNKVDIWCVGVIIFELLIGRIPFLGKDRNTLMYNIVNGKICWDYMNHILNLLLRKRKIKNFNEFLNII